MVCLFAYAFQLFSECKNIFIKIILASEIGVMNEFWFN